MSSHTFLIELKDLRFHAYHGLYPEEKKKGGEFAVDLAVVYIPQKDAASFDGVSLSETIDYSVLYEICDQVMRQPTELLENVALSISRAIQHQFKAAISVEVRITKCKPPIPGCTGSSSVNYSWKA